MTISSAFNSANSALPVERISPRFSEKRDTDKIIAYYEANTHEHVHVRKRDWIEHHAEKGQFLIFETQEGEIIASSAAYDYVAKGDGPDSPSYYEIGSTNFAPKGRGYGLYPFVIASQVIDAFLRIPPGKNFIANVYDDSPVGRKMLVPKAGWSQDNVSKDVLDKFYQTKSPSNDNGTSMSWYAAKSSSLPHQARLVLSEMRRSLWLHKSGEKGIELDFSKFDLAKEHYQTLLMLAYSDFAFSLERNPDRDLEQTRRDFQEFMEALPAPGVML